MLHSQPLLIHGDVLKDLSLSFNLGTTNSQSHTAAGLLNPAHLTSAFYIYYCALLNKGERPLPFLTLKTATASRNKLNMDYGSTRCPDFNEYFYPEIYKFLCPFGRNNWLEKCRFSIFPDTSCQSDLRLAS